MAVGVLHFEYTLTRATAAARYGIRHPFLVGMASGHALPKMPELG